MIQRHVYGHVFDMNTEAYADICAGNRQAHRCAHSVAECTAMHVDICTDICTDMCIGMCVDICVEMCVEMCIGMCINMSMCTLTIKRTGPARSPRYTQVAPPCPVCRHVCRHARRRVCRRVCGHVHACTVTMLYSRDVSVPSVL